MSTPVNNVENVTGLNDVTNVTDVTYSISTDVTKITSTVPGDDTTISVAMTTHLKPSSTTHIPKATTKKPYNCMKSRKDNFTACFKSLGDNAMKYMATQNLTGFLEDMCE